MGQCLGQSRILSLPIPKTTNWILNSPRKTIITHDQDEALKDADFVYVKNWSTYQDYGKIYCNDPEWDADQRENFGRPIMQKVMRCLPVRRNVELSDEILDGPSSIVTREASNRVWAAQAVLAEILRSKG